MNPVLTITIDSGDYVSADKALRIKRDEFKPGIIIGHALAIVEARRALGFSMQPRYLFLDFDPAIDEISYYPCFPELPKT